MIMTDPIADILTRLCSTNRVHHDTASMPYSEFKNAITNMLVEEGYLASTSVEDACADKTLTLTLKYGSHRKSAIRGLQRISKPGLRVYAEFANLPKVRGGFNVTILFAPSDLLTDRQAANKGVGKEVLAYIW